MRRRWIFQSTLGFFGLNQNYRKHLFQQIFDLTYYGKGFTHTEVYHMPIWMRRNYLQLVNIAIEEKNNQEDKAYKDSKSTYESNQKLQRPDVKSRKNIVVNPKLTRR